MKYYYAVINCNTIQTAEKLYNSYNNYEFELTNTRLNLALIPDSLVFPQEVKELAKHLPSDKSSMSSNPCIALPVPLTTPR